MLKGFRRFLNSEPAHPDEQRSSPLLNLSAPEHLEALLARSANEPVIIFKHSSSCAISYFARTRILELKKADDPPVYELVIQASRQLSNEIAAKMNIRHESPQVIVVRHQQATYHTSHGNIEADVLRKAAAEAAIL